MVPEASSEGNACATLLKKLPLAHGPEKIQRLSGQEATADELRKWLSNGPCIFHFAGHAYFVASDSEQGYEGLRQLDPFLRCGLAMAGAATWLNDSKSTSRATSYLVNGLDVLEANLRRTRLVVFSAGHGLAGLCRAAQVAGAQSILASHHSVSDKQNKNLVELFYQKLLGLFV